MTELGHVAECTRRLSKRVQNVLQDGRNVLTIGGDHSIGIGSVDGHVKVYFNKNRHFSVITFDFLLYTLTNYI